MRIRECPTEPAYVHSRSLLHHYSPLTIYVQVYSSKYTTNECFNNERIVFRGEVYVTRRIGMQSTSHHALQEPTITHVIKAICLSSLLLDVISSQVQGWGITVSNVPFHLMPNLHRLILGSCPFIPSQPQLLSSNLSSLLRQPRNRNQIKIGSEMPKQGTRNTNERSVRVLNLALLNDLHRLLIHDDFVEPGFDEAAGEMLDLLSSLN